jgi:hypothetical protein
LFSVARQWRARKAETKKDGCDYEEEEEEDGDENDRDSAASSRPHTATANEAPELALSREDSVERSPDREQDSCGEEQQEATVEKPRKQDRSLVVQKARERRKHRRLGRRSKIKHAEAVHRKKRRHHRHTAAAEKRENEEEEEEKVAGKEDSEEEKKRRLKKRLKRKEREEPHQQPRSQQQQQHCRCTAGEKEEEDVGHKSRGQGKTDEKRQQRRLKKAVGCFKCCADGQKPHRKKATHKVMGREEGTSGTNQKKPVKFMKKYSEDEGDNKPVLKVKKDERQQRLPEVETKEEIIRTIFTSKTSSRNYFNPADYESTPPLLFPKQFCNLRPDRFWKRPAAAAATSNMSEQLSAEPIEAGPSSADTGVGNTAASSTAGQGTAAAATTTAVFTTKASVKEMPPGPPSSVYGGGAAPPLVPRTQVQQMLRVLKDATRGATSGRKRKEATAAGRRAANEDSRMKEAMETTYEVSDCRIFSLHNYVIKIITLI